MAEKPSKKPSGITLEQLIQLKRAEKPAPAFWEGFDRQLHRRQLAALVQVDPWHRRALRAVGGWARRIAPAGAGVAAIALVVLTAYRVDTTATDEATSAVASTDQEITVVELPEEAISVSTISTPPARPRTVLVEFHGQVRASPPAIASGLAAARRFTTVAAPVTFSAGRDASAITSANVLTAGAVLRTLAAGVPESL